MRRSPLGTVCAAVGSVLRQEPAGGTSLPIGRQIVLTVNKPPLMTVPRLEEQTVDQARALLREGGLEEATLAQRTHRK